MNLPAASSGEIHSTSLLFVLLNLSIISVRFYWDQYTNINHRWVNIIHLINREPKKLQISLQLGGLGSTGETSVGSVELFLRSGITDSGLYR